MCPSSALSGADFVEMFVGVGAARVHADRVAKISIIPRGVAALGYTQQQPTEDRYLMTRAELLDRLDVLLGGRTAEEIIFGDVSTDLIRHMITRYGMSEALGLATFEAPRQAPMGQERTESGRAITPLVTPTYDRV